MIEKKKKSQYVDFGIRKQKVYKRKQKHIREIKLKELPHIGSISLVYQKNKSLYQELLEINAFCGDTYLRNHYTQDSLIFAYRNNHSLYNLHTSIFGLKKALHFLRKQKKNTFIFVGSPYVAKDECVKLFRLKNIPFFPTYEWFPGYISKKARALTKVLIIYDISTNYDAKREAFNAKFPIVAFLSPYGDIGGVDYPISLNLEHCGIWYHSLWKSFFIQV